MTDRYTSFVFTRCKFLSSAAFRLEFLARIVQLAEMQFSLKIESSSGIIVMGDTQIRMLVSIAMARSLSLLSTSPLGSTGVMAQGVAPSSTVGE